MERLFAGPARVAGEDRFESKEKEERDIEGSFNIESKLTDTIIHVNGRIQSGESSDLTESRREPVNADRDRQRFVRGSSDDSLSIELGGDIRFPITEALTGKGIALFNYSDSDASSFREIFDAGSRIETVSRAPKSTQKTESIVRLEFDWKRFPAHHLEVNLEGLSTPWRIH